MRSDYKVFTYQAKNKKEWDTLIAKSPNSTLLHFRDFMEYHKDRFEDASLLFLKNDKLAAVLPASMSDQQLASHAGLTYGGLVVGLGVDSKDVFCFFECLIEYLKRSNVTAFLYKQMPYVYHQAYASIDEYALFRFGFELQSCSISSFCQLPFHSNYTLEKKRSIQKATRAGLSISTTEQWGAFWTILENNLAIRYDGIPTHTLSEIKYLKEKFPQQIQLIGAFEQQELLAATVLFISEHVVHLQYIASSARGRQLCANDLLVSTILETYSGKQHVFDYGVSTEKDGQFLNLGLLHHKEGFGLRPVMYNTYRLQL